MQVSLPNHLRLGLAVAVVGLCRGAHGIEFKWLGESAFDPTIDSFSESRSISADGNTVVGILVPPIPPVQSEAYRWSVVDQTGWGLGNLGPSPDGTVGSRAESVSSDGSVSVGSSTSSLGTQAFRWSASDGIVGLGGLAPLPDGGFISEALDVSADGRRIVGRAQGADGEEAFLWSAVNEMVGLGRLPGGDDDSVATAISADGHAVVGASGSSSGREAFTWRSETGMDGLGDLQGGDFHSRALAVSSDGSAIAGFGTSETGREAVRWTATGGMIGLGHLPAYDVESYATAVSADGRVIVGVSRSNDRGRQPFLWDPVHGMRSLNEITVGLGVDLSGTDSVATGISADGRVISGFGTGPSLAPTPWVLIVPEPSTAMLTVVGLIVAAATVCAPRIRLRTRKWR